MKKPFLLISFFLICLKCYPIIYWQPYPIYAAVTGTSLHQRVECSVYDSLLGGWQYYTTPYYHNNIDLFSSGPIITYTTYNPSNSEQDSLYGFIIYDIEQHIFKPVEKSFPQIVLNHGAYDLATGDAQVAVSTRYCCSNWGDWTAVTIFSYDIFSHTWFQNLYFLSDGYWGDTHFSLGYGGFNFVGGSWHSDDANGGARGPLAPLGLGYLSGFQGYFGDGGGSPDLFYTQSDGQLDNNVSIYAADPDPLITDDDFGISNPDAFQIHNGIFFSSDIDAGESCIGIYDDSLHQWVIDTISYLVTDVKIKDRVVAYSDLSHTMVYYEAFSPTQRAWIRDSSTANGIDTLFIDSGTVTWTDAGMNTFIAGYNDPVGWGNFQTPLQLNFHLTDFYPSKGYPVFFVRDYSIGTDDTWYDFGDGVTTVPGTQHSLYYLYKVNGHYVPQSVDYSVCIKANTSSGVQSWCGSWSHACSVSFDFVSPCIGSCNGTAQALPSTGNSPFTYVWSNGEGTSTIDSLCSGNYSVTVTDSSGCSVSYQVSFDTLKTSKSVSGISCNGLCDGQAAVIPSGGNAPYTFLWNNGDTTSIASALCAGNYTVTVMDSTQCAVTANVVVPQPTPLNPFNVIDSQPNCFDSLGGRIEIWCEGGTGPYSIIYSPMIGTFDNYHDSIFTLYSLPGGVYSITITDANGCQVSYSDTLSFPAPITSFDLTGIDVSCFGYCDGSFSYNVIGGTPPYYLHQWGIGPIGPDTLCPGNYVIEIEDGYWCSALDTITIVEPQQLAATHTPQNPSCAGCMDGHIALNISGGTAPYTVSWNPTIGYLSGDTLLQLGAGVYYITITDTNLCTIFLFDSLDDPLSVPQFDSENDFWITPNPANSQFAVGSRLLSGLQFAIETIEIYNSIGEKMTTRISSADTNKMIVDVEDFDPGIYFVKIISKQESVVRKIILD